MQKTLNIMVEEKTITERPTGSRDGISIMFQDDSKARKIESVTIRRNAFVVPTVEVVIMGPTQLVSMALNAAISSVPYIAPQPQRLTGEGLEAYRESSPNPCRITRAEGRKPAI